MSELGWVPNAGVEREALVSLQGGVSAAAYSQAEVAPALRGLTVEQKTAVVKIAKVYARRTIYGYEDLVQEAFTRVLDGRREWPVGVDVVQFLCGVMRSIAWDWRMQRQDHGADEETQSEPASSEEGNAIARIDAQKILGYFDDDPIAKRILLGMMDGARGEDLRELSGLTKTEYESKRTKIRRRLEKLAF